MSDKDFGVWEGEKTIDLPAQTDAGVYFIGRIRTPWKERKDCPKNARESDAVCTIDLDPRWAEGLKDVESCSHLVLLYWMDKSPRNLVLQVPSHYGVQRGTFALRSPARPNPIAMSVVKLLRGRGRQTLGRRPRLPGRHAACSTSSPISPPPTACPRRWWAGTQSANKRPKASNRCGASVPCDYANI